MIPLCIGVGFGGLFLLMMVFTMSKPTKIRYAFSIVFFLISLIFMIRGLFVINGGYNPL